MTCTFPNCDCVRFGAHSCKKVSAGGGKSRTSIQETQAMTAPEKIWTTGGPHSGSWTSNRATYKNPPKEVEYVRSDLVDIAKIQDLLHDDLYGSKDWRHANVLGRIDWLILMLANKNEEIGMWVEMVIDQGEKK